MALEPDVISTIAILGNAASLTVISASRRDWLCFLAFCSSTHGAAQRATLFPEVLYAWASPMDSSSYVTGELDDVSDAARSRQWWKGQDPWVD
jgi:hypothetical protein